MPAHGSTPRGGRVMVWVLAPADFPKFPLNISVFGPGACEGVSLHCPPQKNRPPWGDALGKALSAPRGGGAPAPPPPGLPPGSLAGEVGEPLHPGKQHRAAPLQRRPPAISRWGTGSRGEAWRSRVDGVTDRRTRQDGCGGWGRGWRGWRDGFWTLFLCAGVHTRIYPDKY